MRNCYSCIAYVVMSFFLINLTSYAPSYVWAGSFPEVKSYMELLKSPNSNDRLDASKRIFRVSLQDPEVFEMVNSILLKEYKSEPKGRQSIDELAWHCKVLSISGDEKYRDSLKEVATNAKSSKLKKHAAKSLKIIDETIKKDKIRLDSGLSPEEIDLITMLRAKNHIRKIIASKKITHMVIENENFFDLVNEVLLEEYNKIPNEYEEDDYGEEVIPMQSFNETMHHDVVSWLCKALASSKMHKYKKTLQMISEESIYPKLRKYAKESLARLN